MASNPAILAGVVESTSRALRRVKDRRSKRSKTHEVIGEKRLEDPLVASLETSQMGSPITYLESNSALEIASKLEGDLKGMQLLI